jgi:hypothetical protein
MIRRGLFQYLNDANKSGLMAHFKSRRKGKHITLIIVVKYIQLGDDLGIHVRKSMEGSEEVSTV